MHRQRHNGNGEKNRREQQESERIHVNAKTEQDRGRESSLTEGGVNYGLWSLRKLTVAMQPGVCSL